MDLSFLRLFFEAELITIILVKAVEGATLGLVVFDQGFCYGWSAELRVRVVLKHDHGTTAPVGVLAVRNQLISTVIGRSGISCGGVPVHFGVSSGVEFL